MLYFFVLMLNWRRVRDALRSTQVLHKLGAAPINLNHARAWAANQYDLHKVPWLLLKPVVKASIPFDMRVP